MAAMPTQVAQCGNGQEATTANVPTAHAQFDEDADDMEVIDALFREIDTDHCESISMTELSAARDKYSGHAEMLQVLQGLLDNRGVDPHAPAVAHPPTHPLISRDQFRKAFSTLPRVRGERVRWARGLGLEGELARLLRPGNVFDGLKGLKELKEAEMQEYVADVCRRFGEVLPALLLTGLRKLRSTGGGTGSEVQEHINSKFVLDGAFVGRFATLDDFFAGPEQLIGTPNPKIEEGMETEHCRRGNCENCFTTGNYNLTTWPKLEWEFVVAPKEGVRYPHTPKDKSKWLTWRGPLGCRSRIVRGECLLEEARWKGPCGRDAEALDVHVKKPEVTRAGLSRAEVIGLRLYTGPLFVLYNAVLRGFPDKDVALLLDKEGRENRYETTIFVIASGVTKLSKLTGVPEDRKVFRGLGGMVLPRQFWELFPESQITFEVAAADTAAVKAVLKSIKNNVSGVAAAAAAPSEGNGMPAARTAANTRTTVTEISCEYLEVGQASWLLPAGGQEGLTARQQQLARVAQEMASKGARVVKEAKAGGRGVRMSVALPVAKHAFVERHRTAFEQAVRALCGGRDVAVLDVADKPLDFRGGGERLRVEQRLAGRHEGSDTCPPGRRLACRIA